MGRAAGRHVMRMDPGDIDPDSGEGRQLGMSDRVQGTPSPIPGGKDHIVNAETMRQKVPVAEPGPETPAQNAHGVYPGSATTRERADLERGMNDHRPLRPAAPVKARLRPTPVPVYLVSDSDAGEHFRTANPQSTTLQAAGGQPTKLCGRDRSREYVLLLNESTSSDVRFGQFGDVSAGGGSLLPWPSNSYLRLHTQDEIWALSADSGTPAVSVIQVCDTPGTGE